MCSLDQWRCLEIKDILTFTCSLDLIQTTQNNYHCDMLLEWRTSRASPHRQSLEIFSYGTLQTLADMSIEHHYDDTYRYISALCCARLHDNIASLLR